MTTSKNDITIIREFNMPVEKVWEAWTVPAICKQWWGPTDFTCPHCSIDLREGGKYLSCMLSPQGEEFWSTGTYKQIIPFKKLVQTDSFSDEKGNVVNASHYKMPGEWPMELMVTIAFESVNGKTKLTLNHTGLPAEMADDCKLGWEQSLDKLEKNLS